MTAALHFIFCPLKLSNISPGAAISHELTIWVIHWFTANFDVTAAPIQHRYAVGKIPKRQMRCKVCIMLSPVWLIQFPTSKLVSRLANNHIWRYWENLVETL